MLYKNLIFYCIFLVCVFCNANEMDNSPIDTRDMHLFPISSFKQPLAESTYPIRKDFKTDSDFIIHTMRIVQGSMPIYKTLSKKDDYTLMTDEYGDCKQIVFRYINYTANESGFNTKAVWYENKYIPGHALVLLKYNNNNYLLDLNHSVLIQFNDKFSKKNWKIFPFALAIEYYIPYNAFKDNSTLALLEWLEHVKNYRWPKYLNDYGKKILDHYEVLESYN